MISLPRVVGKNLVDEILVPLKNPLTGVVIKWIGNLRFFAPLGRPFMPVEFLRRGLPFWPQPGAVQPLTQPPQRSPHELPIFDIDKGNDLRGGKPFKPEHRVSWFRFFHFPEITHPKTSYSARSQAAAWSVRPAASPNALIGS
jgi:hypothetical protein